MFNHKHPEPFGELAEPWRRVYVSDDFVWFGGSAGSPTEPTETFSIFTILLNMYILNM